jgi:hypothetical protein
MRPVGLTGVWAVGGLALCEHPAWDIRRLRAFLIFPVMFGGTLEVLNWGRDQPGKALRALVAEHGVTVLDDPTRVRDRLERPDLALPAHQRSVLVMAAYAALASRLAEQYASGRSRADVVEACAAELRERTMLSDPEARWAVAVFAGALGRAVDAPAPPQRPSAPPPAAASPGPRFMPDNDAYARRDPPPPARAVPPGPRFRHDVSFGDVGGPSGYLREPWWSRARRWLRLGRVRRG